VLLDVYSNRSIAIYYGNQLVASSVLWMRMSCNETVSNQLSNNRGEHRGTGAVSFSDTEFSSGKVNFVTAEFSGGDVDFSGAKFSGSAVSFNSAKFSGSAVSFNSAKFSGSAVSFSEAKFSGGEVGFLAAEFPGGEVDFSDPGDWSSPPKFTLIDIPPPGVKLPRKEDQIHGLDMRDPWHASSITRYGRPSSP